LRMAPTQLAFLNPMLIPAASLKLVSGRLDTVHLKAIGGDEVASGEITLFYHNLKVALLKQGDETHKGVWRGDASVLAIKLIVKITLFYHILIVALLKQGDETHKGFWRGAVSFLANKLLIKRKNAKRTEPIVFYRNRDRSVFNYWIKITMRGVAASVGIKTNK